MRRATGLSKSEWGTLPELVRGSSRTSLPRKGRRVGPHVGVFEACPAFTRLAVRTLAPSRKWTGYTEGFSHFVTSVTPPVAPAVAFAGWDLHPPESAAFPAHTRAHTSNLTPCASGSPAE